MAVGATELPTRLSEEVRDAVAEEYAAVTSIPIDIVVAGFTGGLEFDSVIGVELSVGLEERLGVSIPEKRLLNSHLYRCLQNYALEIQSLVDSGRSELEDNQ